MRFCKHISFYHGGNNYITFSAAAFENLIHKYNLSFITSDFLSADCINLNQKTYNGKKENIREFARLFQEYAAGAVLSWDDVIKWTAFFEYAGKKYGLLKEFRTEGII